MSTMHALRIHEFGGPDKLRADRVEVPQPGQGQVLVKVLAASLNPVDYKTREGRYPLVREDSLPYTLGRDFAGKVEALGSGAAGVSKGDTVYAFVGQGQGAFAEYVVVDDQALAPAPSTLDVRMAAAVPLAGLTAWQGLFEHGGLQAGQKVLIHAGAGGVGHLAVQFAHVKGARVTVTASGDGVNFVRSLGAEHVIDYRKQDFAQIVKDVDLVFDLVGGDTQEKSWDTLKDGGALVSTVQEPSKEKAQQRGIRTARYTARPDGRQLAEIGELIDKRKVRVYVSDLFPFRDAPKAERLLQDGHRRGKMVLNVASA